MKWVPGHHGERFYVDARRLHELLVQRFHPDTSSACHARSMINPSPHRQTTCLPPVAATPPSRCARGANLGVNYYLKRTTWRELRL